MNDAHKPLLLHVPGLQPEHACAALPAETRFVSPGLPGTESEAFWKSPDLPFSAAEARSCLHEMVTMGEQFGNTRDLITLALQPVDDVAEREQALRREMAALDQFAETGELAHGADAAKRQDESRLSAIAAQKALVLAWNLESRVHELHGLASGLSETAQRFRSALGVTEDDDLGELPGLAQATGALPVGDTGRMNWRVILDAVLRFAPDDAVLVTCDAHMADALRELAAPVAPDADSAIGTGAEHPMFCIPAWRLLGHGGVPAERPWLNRELRILLCDCTPAG